MYLKKLIELPPRKRIGILALVLGFIALFADDPYNNAAARVNLKDIALSSVDDVERIDAQDIADWLIKGKLDYRLIDLRNEEDYTQYSIPSSENVKMENLLRSGLLRNEKILLYSDDEISASKAWFILKAAEYKSVSILKGGLEKWKSDVLFPICSCGEEPSEEQLHLHAKLSEVSEFFGGKMQSSNIAETSSDIKMPEIKAPANIILKKTAGKKKREGC